MTPRDLLKEYEKQMALVSLKTCAELAQIAQAAHEGQIGAEQAEYLTASGGAEHDPIAVSRFAAPDPRRQNPERNETAITGAEFGRHAGRARPDSSPDVSQVIAKDLELTPVQIAAIQAQIEKERGRVRPLTERLADNRRAL